MELCRYLWGIVAICSVVRLAGLGRFHRSAVRNAAQRESSQMRDDQDGISSTPFCVGTHALIGDAGQAFE
jgi:hypothetical protein